MRYAMSAVMVGLLLASAGCGTRHGGRAFSRIGVAISTYRSHDLPFPMPAQGVSIGVVARSSAASPMLMAEVQRKAEIMLRGRGYEVAPASDATYALFVTFSIDNGSTATGARPVYVPGGTATTYMYGSNGRWGNATTNLPGSYQYVPYSETYFCRFMEMSLYKHETFVTVDKYDKAQAVWSSEAFSAGSSSDLRLVSDYLLVATFQYFGQDTGQRVQEMLHAKDKRVKALQEAVASTQPAP